MLVRGTEEQFEYGLGRLLAGRRADIETRTR